MSVPDEGYYVPDEGYYVPDEGYSRNTWYALSWMLWFVLQLIQLDLSISDGHNSPEMCNLQLYPASSIYVWLEDTAHSVQFTDKRC
jgi:hypothetical protein